MEEIKRSFLPTLLGASLCLSIAYYIRQSSIKALKAEIRDSIQSAHKSLDRIQDSEEEFLIREQLSRNYSFLGEEHQNAVRSAFVIVVGLGGVGSHAAHMLLRSGVQRLRLIDFDQVTLSSLNRHAVAVREDVGTPKVETMKKHLLKILPHADIEVCTRMFNLEAASSLITGEPDFVLDCIDNINTKVDLLQYCVENKIRVISSMGSGAKCDPTRIQIADISETFEDPLARATRKGLRLRGITSGIPVVFSTEKPGNVGLVPLDESKVKEAREFATLPDFRVRILPVLGTLPALFGNTMASYVVTQLAHWQTEPLPFKSRDKIYQKLLRDMLLKEIKMHGNSMAIALSVTDVGFIFEEIWRGRSALSGQFEKLVLTRWNPQMPITYGNIICLTRQEAEEHSHVDPANWSSHYKPDFLNFVERRLQKEKEENEWRLYF